MNQIWVLFAVIGASLASPSLEPRNCNFHLQNSTFGIDGRIIGGVEADIRDLPYQAALLRNGSPYCGAAIIGDDTMLTAAHCVTPKVMPNINWLSFRVGSSQSSSGGQKIFAREIIIHERYQLVNNLIPVYDIAVVKLQERISVQDATAIRLANANHHYPEGSYGVVSGWGHTSMGGTGTETLRRVDVPVVGESRCRAAYGSVITEKTICAGYAEGGKDACQGDSGGPYAINGELAGITSWGFGCALASCPGVYSSVPGFREWIRSHSGI